MLSERETFDAICFNNL